MEKVRRLLTAALALAFVGAGCTGAGFQQAPRVLLVTEEGPVTIELYTEAAPVSAGDFLRYLKSGLLEKSVFYRVVRPDNDNGSPTITVVQGGLLAEDEYLAPVKHETTAETGLAHTHGAVSLARFEPGTGGASAFFICIGDNPGLDFGGLRNPDGLGFAVFGKVVSGMDVIVNINSLPGVLETDDPYVRGQLLKKPVRILAAKRL